MSTLHVPDHLLKAAGLNESEALVEFACRLFEAGRLSLWQAAEMAGLSRSGIEAALLHRQIPLYRPTVEELEQDLPNLDLLESEPKR